MLSSYPLPTENALKEYYQGFLFDPPSRTDAEKNVKKKEDDLVKWFGKIKGDKLLLDYGGGVGYTYAAAKRLGFDAKYYDVDIQSMEVAKSVLGLSDEDIVHDFKGLTFDYIVSDNVIEHLAHPKDHIVLLFNMLKPGGKLLLKTPNAGNSETYFSPIIYLNEYLKDAIKYNGVIKALKSFLMFPHWHISPPRHLYSFTEESFRGVLKQDTFKKNCKSVVDTESGDWVRHSSYYYLIRPWQKNFKPKYILYIFVLIPFIVIELFFKSLQIILLKANLLSKSELIFVLTKDNEP
jgi:SAM-dependent methyltransferase